MTRPLVTGNRTGTLQSRGVDFYASPYAALPPLLVAERRRLPLSLWEPACGNGALVLPLRNRGYEVLASDITGWGCPHAIDQVDFLGERAAKMARLFQGTRYGIVTNPPFNVIEEFIETAVRYAPYVAILARLAFLESNGRYGWWQKVRLQRVHVISDRLPMMHRHGWDGPQLDKAAMCFCWFIFERDRKPRTAVPIRWWRWKECCRKYPQTDADIPPQAREQLPLFGEVGREGHNCPGAEGSEVAA